MQYKLTAAARARKGLPAHLSDKEIEEIRAAVLEALLKMHERKLGRPIRINRTR